jgi:hypothetical protein
MLTLFRVLAAVLLLVAAIAGIYDATRSMAAGRLVLASLLDHWSTLAPALLNSAQSAVKRATHPMVWDAGPGWLLRMPASLVLFVLGAALAYAGRRRRHVNVFAN